jgi:integrase
MKNFGGRSMNTAQPIRTTEELERFKAYYRTVCPKPRNYLLIILGLNTALRISDTLSLQWCDVYHFETQQYRTHLHLVEQKTGKTTQIYLNRHIYDALDEYRADLGTIRPEQYLFENYYTKGQPISRVQAFRIIKKAAQDCGFEGVISCHSLRKTFGYHAWKQGVPPTLLVTIYNHSSYDVTKRYLGIEQDDKDQVYRNIEL